MRRAKRIMVRLGPLGEPRQTALLAQAAHPVAPAGQHLVRVTLVAHVPDQFVTGGIEYRMQGDGQFNHTQR